MNYVNLGRQFGGSRSAWKARTAEQRSKSKPTVGTPKAEIGRVSLPYQAKAIVVSERFACRKVV